MEVMGGYPVVVEHEQSADETRRKGIIRIDPSFLLKAVLNFIKTDDVSPVVEAVFYDNTNDELLFRIRDQRLPITPHGEGFPNIDVEVTKHDDGTFTGRLLFPKNEVQNAQN